jgi:biotin carboxylase
MDVNAVDTSTPSSTLVLVDPVSTGRSVALAARERGVSVLALWSAAVEERERDLAFSAEVDALRTIEATIEALVRAAGCHERQLLVMVGGDDGVPLADALSARLHAPIAAAHAPLNRRAKHAQQTAVARAQMRACESASGTRWDDGMAAVCARRLPVVVKLDEGTGTEGLRVCATARDARAHVDWLLANQRPPRASSWLDARAPSPSACLAVVVQPMLVGDEYAIDTVSSGGVHKVVMLWRYDKRRSNGAHFVYYGERPLAADSAEAALLIPYVVRVLDALGVLAGPAHTEVVLVDNDGSPDGRAHEAEAPAEAPAVAVTADARSDVAAAAEASADAAADAGSSAATAEPAGTSADAAVVIGPTSTSAGSGSAAVRGGARSVAPCLVEVNLRCHGGSGVWSSLAQRLVGYSQIDAALDQALHASLSPQRSPQRSAWEALPARPPALSCHAAFLCLVNFRRGRVRATPGLDSLCSLRSYVSAHPMGVCIGATVEVTVDLGSLIGMVTLAHELEEVLEADVATVSESATARSSRACTTHPRPRDTCTRDATRPPLRTCL